VQDCTAIFFAHFSAIWRIDGPFRAVDFLCRIIEYLQGTIVPYFDIDSLRRNAPEWIIRTRSTAGQKCNRAQHEG
jgi:hypothetical protein